MKISKIGVSLLTLAVVVIMALAVAAPVQAASWKKSIVKQNEFQIQDGMDTTYTFVEFTLKSKAKVTFLSSDSAGSHYGGEVFKGTSSQLEKDFQAKKYNNDAWYDNVMSYESSEAIDDNTYSKTYTLDKGTYTFYTGTIKQDSTHKVKISAKKKVLKFKKLRTLQIFSGMY